MQDVWERDFKMTNPLWHLIYKDKIWDQKDLKLAEFNYKHLCNIIYTKHKISKWNKNMNDKCDFCGEIQNTKHLLFECPQS